MGVTGWHCGRQLETVPAVFRERYVLGLDLGQSSDPTAIAVLQWRCIPGDAWLPTTDKKLVQASAERFDVRHLERLPLGMSYPAIVDHVARILARPPLSEGCELVIDHSGVGRAVFDVFVDAGMEPIGVTITAGLEATPQGGRRFHVAKGILISTLDARLHTGELRFAASLTQAGAMAEELKDFRRRVSGAGRYQYEARTGKHDDLVLAVAIAVWWASRPQASTTAGHLAGLI